MVEAADTGSLTMVMRPVRVVEGSPTPGVRHARRRMVALTRRMRLLMMLVAVVYTAGVWLIVRMVGASERVLLMVTVVAAVTAVLSVIPSFVYAHLARRGRLDTVE